MAKVNGTSLLLIVDGQTIAATKSFTLNLDANNIDTSSKDSEGWTDRGLQGKRDWSVDFDGLYDPAGVYNFEQLYDDLNGRSRVYLEMATIDGTGGGELYKGYARPKGLKMGAVMEEAATIAGTFEADGRLTKGTVATS